MSDDKKQKPYEKPESAGLDDAELDQVNGGGLVHCGGGFSVSRDCGGGGSASYTCGGGGAATSSSCGGGSQYRKRR